MLTDGRTAPRLYVRFYCAACHVSEVRDAYAGPALHTCRKPWPIMSAERIVSEQDVPT